MKTAVGTKTKLRTAVIVAVAAIGLAAAAFVGLVWKSGPSFALARFSPGGSGPVGFNPVLGVDVTAPSTAVTLYKMLFKVTTTDNASTSWNTYSSLGTGTKWALWQGAATRIDDPAGWTFYNSSMTPCSSTDVIAYAQATLAFSLPVSTTTQFVLRVDTSGASMADADTLRIDIPKSKAAVSWTDAAGVLHGGALLKGLPITGNTITYTY